MKRFIFAILIIIIFHAVDVHAANWYVRSNGGGGSGTSWTAAWNDLGAINWTSVQCGDTIWVAGGTYGNWLQPAKDCTSGAQLYIRRARSDSTECTGSAGWSSGYDSTVIQANGAITFSDTANYLTISGRTSASGGGYGWVIQNTTPYNQDAYGMMMWNGSSTNYLTVEYMDFSGPDRQCDDPSTPGGWGTRGISATSWSGSSGHQTYSHLKVHGWAVGIYDANASNNIYEYIDMYNISSKGGNDHPDLFYIVSTSYGTIRYSKFYDSTASGTGIWFDTTGGTSTTTSSNNNWQIYGNLFYDNTQNTAGAIGLARGIYTGMKIFNNTFTNNYFNIRLVDATCGGSGNETRNNIFSDMGGSTTCGTSSNNLTTTNDAIFYNYGAKDFRIVSTVGNGYPRNAGTSLSANFTKDIRGATFGGEDGLWDIGAYEYGTWDASGYGGATYAAIPSSPRNLSIK